MRISPRIPSNMGVEKLDGYNNFTGEFNGTTIAPKVAGSL
jgi:hypothetical protein